MYSVQISQQKTSEASPAAKLEQTVHCPPQGQQQQFQWTGTERQPPPWTDELAEMSRHIYTRQGIAEGPQKPVFQVRNAVCYG